MGVTAGPQRPEDEMSPMAIPDLLCGEHKTCSTNATGGFMTGKEERSTFPGTVYNYFLPWSRSAGGYPFDLHGY